MKNKKEKILLAIMGICLIFTVFTMFNLKTNNDYAPVDKSQSIDNINTKPKTSGNWILSESIIIDDSATGVGANNWTWAVAQEWCSGSGTSEDPDLIENVTISQTEGNLTISIIHSDATVYFTLNNVTIEDTGDNGIGILLNDTVNGKITNSIIKNNGDIGIEIIDSNSTIVTGNTIVNNTNIGITIIESEKTSENNEFYGNDFDNNDINGQDNCSVANTWDNGVDSGNEWDDYTGADLDDDGIGDDPYDISGSAEAQDNYPIWDDGDSIAPTITITKPTTGQKFNTPPAFIVVIVEAVAVSTRWYTINAGVTNTTFTTNGTLSKAIWATVTGYAGQTKSVTLTFYANDTTGNEGSASVVITKVIPTLTPEDEEKDEALPDYYVEQVYVVITIIGVFCLFKVKKYYKQLNMVR